jgi:hypothetical protein
MLIHHDGSGGTEALEAGAEIVELSEVEVGNAEPQEVFVCGRERRPGDDERVVVEDQALHDGAGRKLRVGMADRPK